MSRRMNFMLTGLTPARRDQIVREVGAQKPQRDSTVSGCIRDMGSAPSGEARRVDASTHSASDMRTSCRSGNIDRAEINDMFSTAFSTVRSRQR